MQDGIRIFPYSFFQQKLMKSLGKKSAVIYFILHHNNSSLAFWIIYKCHHMMWENEEEIDGLETSVVNNSQWNTIS